MTDGVGDTPYRMYGSEPMLVRRGEATRFLWGDEGSGQVSDLIYGRGERISGLIFSLGPGHWFRTSEAWKPIYDQHRFYYVVAGSLAIHDPESGEVAVAHRGEAITWRGHRYHFGYNVGDDEVVVLDWFAPPEGGPEVPEQAIARRDLGEWRGGRHELLGSWPDRRPEVMARSLADGGLATVTRGTALHVIHGSQRPMLVSILISTEQMTAGTFSLAAGTRSEPEDHPGDEVVFSIEGRLHVYLPDRGDWFDLDPLDCLYLPEGTVHEYWSYGADRTSAVFCVAPRYR